MPFNSTALGTATTGSFVADVFSDSFDVGFNEVNMVALQLQAGTVYTVDVDNSGNVADLYLRIFDAFGVEVRANDDGNRSGDDLVFSLSPWVEFAPNYTGLHYFAISPYYLDSYDPATTAGRVSPENPLALSAGTLRVAASGPNFWPAAASINANIAESLNDETDMLRDEDRTIRAAYTGAIDSAFDVDIARMDLDKNDIVVIDVNGLDGNGTVLRVFDDNGVQIGFDDDAGFGEDPELVFAVPNTDDYYIGISGEGNSAYVGLDGTGAVAGAIGAFEVIVHRNPTLIGSALSNNIPGTAQDDYVVLGAGNDQSNGGFGFDTLAGGDDNDTLQGSDGSDVLYGEQGNDVLDGGPGRDVALGGIGNDRVNGGGGVFADLLDGGAGADTLNDGAGNDTLFGGAGNDSLFAGGNDNLLLGEDGNDTLVAGSGADSMFGGAGDDSMRAGSGDNVLDGGLGNDTIRAGTNDSITGGGGDDLLFAGGGTDTVSGGADADTLDGGDGADLLAGDAGADLLLGGEGADTLRGGTGSDTLNGGNGADIFDFDATAEQTDVILGFQLGLDRIDLTGIFGAGVVNAVNLAQFVQVTQAGLVDSFLAVDANGVTGGLNFIIIAQVAALTPVQLFDANNFIL
jgi:Ca2+-binding RTX toxin-like protein